SVVVQTQLLELGNYCSYSIVQARHHAVIILHILLIKLWGGKETLPPEPGDVFRGTEEFGKTFPVFRSGRFGKRDFYVLIQWQKTFLHLISGRITLGRINFMCGGKTQRQEERSVSRMVLEEIHCFLYNMIRLVQALCRPPGDFALPMVKMFKGRIISDTPHTDQTGVISCLFEYQGKSLQ